MVYIAVILVHVFAKGYVHVHVQQFLNKLHTELWNLLDYIC